MNYMSSVSVTVRGDSFACVPSLVCRGRVTLLTCFACCAVSIYNHLETALLPDMHYFLEGIAVLLKTQHCSHNAWSIRLPQVLNMGDAASLSGSPAAVTATEWHCNGCLLHHWNCRTAAERMLFSSYGYLRNF
jgi:hypothetical protein